MQRTSLSRKGNQQACVRIASVVLALLLFVSPALATIVQAMSMRDLVRASSLIVIGQVEGQQARYDEQGRIVTDVTLRVEECFHGAVARSSRITIERLGGAVGDIGMHVEGEPRFENGERLVLFGQRFVTPRGPVVRPVGMAQGVLPMEGEMVLPNGEGLGLVTRDASGHLAPSPSAVTTPRPRDAVVEEIQALVAEVHGAP